MANTDRPILTSLSNPCPVFRTLARITILRRCHQSLTRNRVLSIGVLVGIMCDDSGKTTTRNGNSDDAKTIHYLLKSKSKAFEDQSAFHADVT